MSKALKKGDIVVLERSYFHNNCWSYNMPENYIYEVEEYTDDYSIKGQFIKDTNNYSTSWLIPESDRSNPLPVLRKASSIETFAYKLFDKPILTGTDEYLKGIIKEEMGRLYSIGSIVSSVSNNGHIRQENYTIKYNNFFVDCDSAWEITDNGIDTHLGFLACYNNITNTLHKASIVSEPKPIDYTVNPFISLKIGDTLSEKLINDWVSKNKNFIDTDRPIWKTLGGFYGNRTIIGFEYLERKKAFQVSGTASCIWLNAEGFEEFYLQHLHSSSTKGLKPATAIIDEVTNSKPKFKVGDLVVVTEEHDVGYAGVGYIGVIDIIDDSTIPYRLNNIKNANNKVIGEAGWCIKVRHATPDEGRKYYGLSSNGTRPSVAYIDELSGTYAGVGVWSQIDKSTINPYKITPDLTPNTTSSNNDIMSIIYAKYPVGTKFESLTVYSTSRNVIVEKDWYLESNSTGIYFRNNLIKDVHHGYVYLFNGNIFAPILGPVIPEEAHRPKDYIMSKYVKENPEDLLGL